MDASHIDSLQLAFSEQSLAVLNAILGLIMFGFSIWLMEKVTPFSIRKEIEEDQNTALGIVIGCALIALAILLASAIK